jgi:glycosyltransferase involved in cell wall biosynthesis
LAFDDPTTSEPPMRTVHVITRLIVGGAQENTLLTVEDQRRIHGDEVVLVTGPGLGPEGSLEPRARANGVDLRILPDLRRALHPWRDFASYRALLAVLREIRPEIVHTHSSKAGILGRAAAARLGIPAVHTVHGAAFHYGQHPLAHRAYRAAEQWAGRRTAAFVSVCDAMTDQYVAAGIAPRDRFTTIYSGMEVEPFLHPPRPAAEVRAELDLRPEHVVVGKVARLFPLKGHADLLRAAEPVCRTRPEVRFLLVGDGLLRGELERRLAELGLADRFRFTGLVPPDRIPELLGATDLVVHASAWEGLARVLPQALLCGKPAVSYDIDGAREVVLPDATGCLVPFGRTDELAAAILRLAADPALRARLGSAGRDLCRDRFRHETATRRIREVYAKVLGRGAE